MSISESPENPAAALLAIARQLSQSRPSQITALERRDPDTGRVTGIDLAFSTNDYHRTLLRIIALERKGGVVLLARRFQGPAREPEDQANNWETGERLRL